MLRATALALPEARFFTVRPFSFTTTTVGVIAVHMFKRRFAVGGGIVGLLVILWILTSNYFRAVEPATATAVVFRGTLEQTVQATGTLEPKELVSVGA